MESEVAPFYSRSMASDFHNYYFSQYKLYTVASTKTISFSNLTSRLEFHLEELVVPVFVGHLSRPVLAFSLSLKLKPHISIKQINDDYR